MSSAAEAEIGGLFINSKTACHSRNMLNNLKHKQPPTPIQTDNETAEGFVHDNIKRNQSKSMDMRFYWLRDRSQQKQFNIYWQPGKINLADYFSKHHPAKYHTAIRTTYLQCNLLQFFKKYTTKTCHCEGVLNPYNTKSHYDPKRS